MDIDEGALEGVVAEVATLAERHEGLTVGDLIDTLGARGFGPLLMALCLFLIPPIGMIPGVGGLIGVLLVLVGVQMLAGRTGLWLPQRLRGRPLDAQRVVGLLARVRPWARFVRRPPGPKLERVATSRVTLTLIAAALIVTGLGMMVLGVVPILPPLMGLPVFVIALGLAERDGRLIYVGGALGVVPLWWGLDLLSR